MANPGARIWRTDQLHGPTATSAGTEDAATLHSTDSTSSPGSCRACLSRLAANLSGPVQTCHASAALLFGQPRWFLAAPETIGYFPGVPLDIDEQEDQLSERQQEEEG